ncbi:hypothetical protein NUU61_008447 [Penicillium alfredii]|uniref:Uncharacterized protein n=1 Tax=Penicillium alfredii TaxID=1506179 RepID=A0A9W9EL56_9EURO|nr:uncharacterized protein NUU61_008447 [Penicillium alfredii]KAJ5083868.1 hypothetical protein NUU61_008447 [Penicillium alfredii]
MTLFQVDHQRHVAAVQATSGSFVRSHNAEEWTITRFGGFLPWARTPLSLCYATQPIPATGCSIVSNAKSLGATETSVLTGGGINGA